LINQVELRVYRDLVAYLDNKLTLAEFRRHFDLASWDTQEWDSDLLSHIELLLAELTSSHRTEAEFKRLLAFSGLTVQIEPLSNVSMPVVATSSNSRLLTTAGLVAISKTPDSFFGKLREAVPA
jgi:hypothetical protein